MHNLAEAPKQKTKQQQQKKKKTAKQMPHI